MLEFKKYKSDKVISNKNFGYTFSILFFALFFVLVYFFNLIIYSLLICSLVLTFITLFFSQILYYPNIIWMSFGKLISIITNPIIFGIIYYITFVPIGYLIKIIYKDYFNYKININKKTYWNKCSEENQFTHNQY